MKYGFVLPAGDARWAADLAHEAKTAGWDGVMPAFDRVLQPRDRQTTIHRGHRRAQMRSAQNDDPFDDRA